MHRKLSALVVCLQGEDVFDLSRMLDMLIVRSYTDTTLRAPTTPFVLCSNLDVAALHASAGRRKTPEQVLAMFFGKIEVHQVRRSRSCSTCCIANCSRQARPL
jgi:hypothetical protein